MEKVIKGARDLAKIIQSTEIYKALDAAKKANDNDQWLQDAIGEFNLIKMQANDLLKAPEESRDNAKLIELDTKLKEKYNEIMANENMIAYNEATKAVDTMMNQVNTILINSINGEDPDSIDLEEGCGGGCSSCAGCH